MCTASALSRFRPPSCRSAARLSSFRGSPFLVVSVHALSHYRRKYTPSLMDCQGLFSIIFALPGFQGSDGMNVLDNRPSLCHTSSMANNEEHRQPRDHCPNAFADWSTFDDERLLDLRVRGRPWSHIARALGRGTNAVQERYGILQPDAPPPKKYERHHSPNGDPLPTAPTEMTGPDETPEPDTQAIIPPLPDVNETLRENDTVGHNAPLQDNVVSPTVRVQTEDKTAPEHAAPASVEVFTAGLLQQGLEVLTDLLSTRNPEIRERAARSACTIALKIRDLQLKEARQHGTRSTLGDAYKRLVERATSEPADPDLERVEAIALRIVKRASDRGLIDVTPDEQAPPSSEPHGSQPMRSDDPPTE